MTRTLLALCLALTACTSPYEEGLELGQEHAEKLRDGKLTFDELTADLNAADRENDEQAQRDDFARGYSEAIEPARKELTKLVAAKLTDDAIEQLGATAEGIVESVRATIETSDGEIDREKIRELGRKVGKLVRDLKESAEEFGKGLEEGVEEKR